MKVVIFAGGYGTRIMEESAKIPKPMVSIGDKPILWHIMKSYAAYGHKEFIICLGYKGYVIKEYFANYYLHNSDIRIEATSGKIEYLRSQSEDWSISLIDTGEDTMTGGRLRRVAPYLEDDETFLLTYGDGLCRIDMHEQIRFHESHGKIATILAVRPSGRFGALALSGTEVRNFIEKPRGDGSYINGGFFVLNRKVIDYIDGDSTVFEKEPLERLVAAHQLQAYLHDGFWECMDTLKDAKTLNDLWFSGAAPWVT
jgi:glucose-1-phosphate cytidylyltransferase